MKRVYDWVIGEEYFVECGIWCGRVTYVGSFSVGKRSKHRFTFGNIENWENQFNLVNSKCNFKVYAI